MCSPPRQNVINLTLQSKCQRKCHWFTKRIKICCNRAVAEWHFWTRYKVIAAGRLHTCPATVLGLVYNFSDWLYTVMLAFFKGHTWENIWCPRIIKMMRSHPDSQCAFHRSSHRSAAGQIRKTSFWAEISFQPCSEPFFPASCVSLKPVSPSHLPFLPVVSDRWSLLGHRLERKKKTAAGSS